MPAVHRYQDKGTGHGCFPPRPNAQGSGNVFINNKGAHIVGHAWEIHGCGVCSPHGGALAQGSGTVYVNGQQLGRIGDPVDCGSSCAEGSPNVFAGG